MKNVNGHEREIERRNWLLAAVLVLSGVFVGLSTYFEVLITHAAVVASIVAVFCGFACMMETIHQSWWGYNAVESLWIPTAIFGAVGCIVGIFGCEIQSSIDAIMRSVAYGFVTLIIPIIGWFIGITVNAVTGIITDLRFK